MHASQSGISWWLHSEMQTLASGILLQWPLRHTRVSGGENDEVDACARIHSKARHSQGLVRAIRAIDGADNTDDRLVREHVSHGGGDSGFSPPLR